MDSRFPENDMVSKILNALNVLEIAWSDIESNRQLNYNWRHSHSLWEKFSKIIFGSNRATQRAKIMNVFRCKRLDISQRLQNPISQLNCESVTFPTSIELQKISSSLSSKCLDRQFIQSIQVTNSYEDSNFPIDHPKQLNPDSLQTTRGKTLKRNNYFS